MAYICYKPKGYCSSCQHYRQNPEWPNSEHKMVCYAQEDHKRYLKIAENLRIHEQKN